MRVEHLSRRRDRCLGQGRDSEFVDEKASVMSALKCFKDLRTEGNDHGSIRRFSMRPWKLPTVVELASRSSPGRATRLHRDVARYVSVLTDSWPVRA
jgi:hypothetical protein